MGLQVKTEPDVAVDSILAVSSQPANAQFILTEAKRLWNSAELVVSSELLEAVNQELRSSSPGIVIKSVAVDESQVTLKCLLAHQPITAGGTLEPSAGCVAILRFINASFFIDKAQSDVEIHVRVNAKSISRAQQYKLVLPELIRYLSRCPRAADVVMSGMFSRLAGWRSGRPASQTGSSSSARETSQESSMPHFSAPRLSHVSRPEKADRSPSMIGASQATSVAAPGLPRISEAHNPALVDQAHLTLLALEGRRCQFQVHELLKDQPLAVLEEGVKVGLKLLAQLLRALERHDRDSSEVQSWCELIKKTGKLATKTRSVLGVVGETGAGKSSVINALVEEESLVPTNCMRPCTAVITEISYQEGDAQYSAEIDYISPDDWRRELDILHYDLVDPITRKTRPDFLTKGSDAASAYAKIKAVYPRLSTEEIERSSPDKLMEYDILKDLGKTTAFSADNGQVFYKKLQKIIDSREKGSKEPALWPLIKVVRLYLKAEALKTGAVIVDLPGVYDSNAARSKVAERYMSQCTGLWVVAPISRAVDNHAAKTLLGTTFRRQLKMDGGFNNVTFICSMTDEINVAEAVDSLQDSPGFAEGMDKLESHRIKLQAAIEKMSDDVGDLRNDKKLADRKMEAIEEDIELWEQMKHDIRAGRIVYAPGSSSSNKRKTGSGSDKASKRRRVVTNGGEESRSATNAHHHSSSEPEAPLTLQQVVSRIEQLREDYKAPKEQKKEANRQMIPLNKKVQQAKNALRVIAERKRALCISSRNEYSKVAIQADYAAGIQEIDEEVAEQADAANFNPDEERRNYAEVSANLRVYCVSSRAYHKMQDRMRQEPHVRGFPGPDDTQIPQLQQHCREVTIKGRTKSCTEFLTTLSSLLNSISIWTSDDGSGVNLSEEDRSNEKDHLQRKLEDLDTQFDHLIESLMRDLEHELATYIYNSFTSAVQAAQNEASATVHKWNYGGLHWCTYAAICRRNGVYKEHDWNNQLIEPMVKRVAPGWERVFMHKVPPVFASFVKETSRSIQEFHTAASSRAALSGIAVAGVYLLEGQLKVYQEGLKNLCGIAIADVNGKARELNREFKPAIEREMVPVYDKCKADYGPGVTNRRRLEMEKHVLGHQNMFELSSDRVKDALILLLAEQRASMEKSIDQRIISPLKRDYMSAFGLNGDVRLLPKSERLVRARIQKIIAGSEAMFKRVLNPEHELEDTEDIDDAAIRALTEEVEGVQATQTPAREREEQTITPALDGDLSASTHASPAPRVSPRAAPRDDDEEHAVDNATSPPPSTPAWKHSSASKGLSASPMRASSTRTSPPYEADAEMPAAEDEHDPIVDLSSSSEASDDNGGEDEDGEYSDDGSSVDDGSDDDRRDMNMDFESTLRDFDDDGEDAVVDDDAEEDREQV